MGKRKKVVKIIRKALETPFTRLGLAVVPRLPRWALLGLARAVGSAVYLCSARIRDQGLANLDLAFGATKTAAEKKWILRESLRNSALVMLDLLWFSHQSAARMERWLVVAPNLREALAKQVPRVGVTGHFGNWELIGRYWSLRAGPVMSVAMPLKNAAVDQLLKQARQVTGQQVIAREGALKRLVRFLRVGGTAGLLLDQNTAPEEGGIFAIFFGKPVAVSPAAGLLASLTGAEIIFAYALPRPDGTYVGEVPRVIAAAEIAGLDRQSAVRGITQRITGFYEEAIRERPEYWVWSYKRWRYIPAGMSPEEFPYYADKKGA
jgi:Kdo2-lipid IVA lauroyltransferase/acyltransferase